jgi:hypothetical protein
MAGDGGSTPLKLELVPTAISVPERFESSLSTHEQRIGMTKVNLDITTYHNNDGEDSDEPYSYRGTTSGTVDSVYVSTDDYHYGYRGMETDLDPPFIVVYAEYMVGDTFGSDYEAAIVGIVKTQEEADDLLNEAEKYEGYGSLSNGYYVPWNGYFESLRGLHYETVDKVSKHRKYR